MGQLVGSVVAALNKSQSDWREPVVTLLWPHSCRCHRNQPISRPNKDHIMRSMLLTWQNSISSYHLVSQNAPRLLSFKFGQLLLTILSLLNHELLEVPTLLNMAYFTSSEPLYIDIFTFNHNSNKRIGKFIKFEKKTVILSNRSVSEFSLIYGSNKV